ncbi:MAG TPA: helix-turn-helix transcriptional regulator [Candidatus Eremiobacteraceae bacterium]|nr:helix-turn-helix transcriptional regulator [Candidatus Eremiobacteraceae bacterium]
MKKVVKSRENRVIRAGKNVFAELNLPDADVVFAKARLVVALAGAIKAQNLSQVEAARMIGLTQPKVSRLLRGDTRGFTIDKIVQLLTRLKRDVEIKVTRAPAKTAVGRVMITGSTLQTVASTKR